MKQMDKWENYMKWCKENRCINKKCICSVGDICEDYRGIAGCKAHISHRGDEE